MNSPVKLPFYVKACLSVIAFYFLIDMLYVGRDIILPILYAIVIAITLSPVINFLVRKKLNRVFAVIFVLLMTTVMVAGMVALLSMQLSGLGEAWPQLVTTSHQLLTQSVRWTSDCFHVSHQSIYSWIDRTTNEFVQDSQNAIGSTLSTVGNILASAVLVPVYFFMILVYQNHLLEFIRKLFQSYQNEQVNEVLTSTKGIIQSYLSGLFVEFAIVSVLNSIGLLLLGIDYAILLGVIGGLLNVIPYIGGIVGVFVFMVVALLTKAPVYVLYVVVLYSFIQFIDNNYIVPKIVGSKVKLNAFVSVIVVIAGAALWGVPGMFLSIPITAILKLIFDRIDSLRPWGFVLGEEAENIKSTENKNPLKRLIQFFIS